MNSATLLDTYYGQLAHYTITTKLQGPCGDEMEIFLDIQENTIKNIKVSSSGCMYTNICAANMARLAHQKTIMEALDISVKDVLTSSTEKIPADHIHCNILAVNTLSKALALYLLENPSP